MLKIKGIKKEFNKNTENSIHIFEDFDLDIKEGTITALLGANGCGKSTLMNIISGSIEVDEGRIFLKGKDITTLKEYERGIRISKVHQNPTAGVSPSLTLLENLSLADKKGSRFSLKSLVNKNKKQRFADLLRPLELGLEDKLDVKAQFLSGGQRQAMSLLLSTLIRPELLLLDEHTAALDPKTSRLIMEKTIEIVKKQKITTVMISHNLRDALKYSDRIIMLHRGKIILDIAPHQITENELVQIFNREYQEEECLAV